MNFQQLRTVAEVARSGRSLTELVEVLNTTQPAISRQIRDLEDELGVEIFMRQGKRLADLTAPGREILPLIQTLLVNIDNLRRAGAEFQEAGEGRLSIAATHTQARYALPRVVSVFSQSFPRVRLSLRQGSPRQVADMLLDGEAELGIATEALASHPELIALPCYSWRHCAVVPVDHPLRHLGRPVTLVDLAGYPIITYEEGFTGRSHIDEAFARAGLRAEIVLEAMDADVIKTYVELGMGVGLVASMAYDAERDRNLAALDVGHLFQENVARLAVRRGVWLRAYAFRFITMLAPQLDEDEVRSTLAGERFGAQAKTVRPLAVG